MEGAMQQSGRNRAWPFIVVRHDMGVNDVPEVFARLMECHGRHPGACDEFWFATGSRKTASALEKEVETFARYRPLCEEHGIALGYQQGLTLGHGAAHDGRWTREGERQFSEDAWQVGRDGARIPYLCPRSPEVLSYEREYARTVMRVARPSSYWIDDDLRLGVCKPDGCFCDRCIAAFNAKTGGAWTRETLVAALWGAGSTGAIRAAWSAFNGESLAIYAAAAREAADALGIPCRLGYQAVSADRIYTARDYAPLLAALSGAAGAPVGIRPGHGFYAEAEPRGMVAKCLAVAREAERCRDCGVPVGGVCYEEENYPRRTIQKTPGAIMTECALALASGCDSLSLYWFSATSGEPIEEYDRFLATLRAARPYFARLAASTRRTRLGGLARLTGPHPAPDFDRYEQTDFDLACAGIPVTVAGPGASAYYLDAKSREEGADSPDAQALPCSTVAAPAFGPFPAGPERAEFLDALDAATGGAFPVRVDALRALRVLPRVLPDGRVDSVTLLNLSIGETGLLEVRVRRPAGAAALLQSPGMAAPATASAAPGARGPAPELVVALPGLAPWQIATIFLTQDSPSTAKDNT